MIHLPTSSANPILLLHLIILLCSSDLAISIANSSENDRQALLCFKSLLSDPSQALSSWTNTSLQFCNWHGVSCSTELPHRAIALDLSSKGLSGAIPPCIANLTSLESLELSNNSFHGSMPPELGLLAQLSYLNLSMNSLSGEIQSTLSSCTQLEVLGLWNNSLQGEIPSALSQCKNIQEINLSNNRLEGSVPTELGMLRNLQILILSGNGLSGYIPPSLGASSLIHVDLGHNSLTGEIPGALANSSLKVLRLMGNSLTGMLPEALFNSSSLTTVCLQNNVLLGSIPPVSATAVPLPLKYLSLRGNRLSGSIPPSFGNLSSLITLGLGQNNLVGSIPESLGHIPTLQLLEFTLNNLSGQVPPSIFNITSLKFLGLGSNFLTGRLPSNIGYALPNIQTLVLTSNRFDGTIPASLLNASHMAKMYIALNMLTGVVPFFGSLQKLEVLDLGGNMLEAGDWGFLSSISNCTQLSTLFLDSNDLRGSLPVSIGNLPNSVQHLWLRANRISGPIPLEIGKLRNLVELALGYNILDGSIPPTILHLRDLVMLGLAQNKLSGQLPDTIGSLSQLIELRLEGNNLSGSIPASIGNCTQLQKLNLSHNSISGSIPSDLFEISSLSIYLDLSHNHLSGEIPQKVGNLINLNALSISNNVLSGNIPSTLGQCVLLESLQMQSNILEGSIPQSFVNLLGLKDMDISENNLSGTFPGFLSSLSNLHILNLSFNKFKGVVPFGGVFSSDGVVSLQGNDGLCTNTVSLGLPLCSRSVGIKRSRKSLVLKLTLSIASFAIITLSCVVIILMKKKKQSVPHFKQPKKDMMRITFQDIIVATNHFSSANLIGSGSFGTVYRGCLELEDNIVAIKIFNLDIFGANESFVAECETLKSIRHRNLVKVITLCSSVDLTGKEFKALVFKHLPNGNLEQWLHPRDYEQGQTRTINLSQTIKIALDVAFALDYLHNHCAYPLIHCDLKPSNVLLDLDMTACIGDFGLAKFLSTSKTNNRLCYCSASLARLKGSIGYIAPEYGLSVEISTRGDVYSFGVLLLEMITRCRPTDEKFNNDLNLHEYVYRAFPNNICDIIDPVLLRDEINVTDIMKNCIIPLARVGLVCSMTSPNARWEMGTVCTEILAIKDAFSSIYEPRLPEEDG